VVAALGFAAAVVLPPLAASSPAGFQPTTGVTDDPPTGGSTSTLGDTGQETETVTTSETTSDTPTTTGATTTGGTSTSGTTTGAPSTGGSTGTTTAGPGPTTSSAGTTTATVPTTSAPVRTTDNRGPATSSRVQLRGVRVAVTRGTFGRRVVVRVQVTAAATARARLLRRTRIVASASRKVAAGVSVLRMTVPKSARAGRYRIDVRVTGGGVTRTAVRFIRVPR
jgi:hypothetical protein